MSGHWIVELWQERPREVSYRCTCRMVRKHQPFGYVPTCPGESTSVVPVRLPSDGGEYSRGRVG